MRLFAKKPRRHVTAPLNDAELAALRAERVRYYNEHGGSLVQLKAELRQLDQAHESQQ